MQPQASPDAPPAAGTPCYGVACIEGVPDGSTPRRMFLPNALTFAPTPFPLKWQPAEDEGHEGSVIVGRVDAMWRDGALIRWVGTMDSAGEMGAEAERLMAGGFLMGDSITADDIDDDDVELLFGDLMDADAPGEDGLVPVDVAEPAVPMNGDAIASLAAKALTADGMVMEPGMMQPSLILMHAGRIRSLTLVAEAAFVEATAHLGESPFTPPIDAQMTVDVAPEIVPVAEPPAEPMVAASLQITIPDIPPESWFEEPTELPPFGSVHITAAGRVYGLLAPAGVDHRGFRPMGQRVKAPRGVDYSEFQNKPCFVASADGHVYRINAGNITMNCGHASPVDPRRADPNFAAQHYENSCSVVARVRVGEGPYGTWVAGALLHGVDGDTIQRMMACALSGDWQNNRLNAALLVPVEGFPTAVASSVRVREDAIVASVVPIRFEQPTPPVDYDAIFDLVASATGRGPDRAFDEMTAGRFAELAAERSEGG